MNMLQELIKDVKKTKHKQQFFLPRGNRTTKIEK